jgi:hypothetical protein
MFLSCRTYEKSLDYSGRWVIVADTKVKNGMREPDHSQAATIVSSRGVVNI